MVGQFGYNPLMGKPGPMPRLRPATVDDAAALRTIRRAAIIELAAVELGRAEADEWAASAESDREARAIQDHDVTVAELRGDPVGWVEVAEDEIAGLYVAPGHAVQGIGSVLMRHAEDKIRSDGHDTAILHSSRNAVRFYEGLGFRQVGQASAERGLPMQKELRRWSS